MKTIALRFGETFAPDCGTIAAHQQLIDQNGFVWYGKMGNAVSDKVLHAILEHEESKILLINSGKPDRYWAYISEVSKVIPPLIDIPEYYRDMADRFKTWFKVTTFEKAPNNIMSKCVVANSGNPLGVVSKHSMSPYFIINVNEENID